MADDKTVRMVTNLDRKAVEGKLVEVRTAAQSANLAELASMFRAWKACRRRRSSSA